MFYAATVNFDICPHCRQFSDDFRRDIWYQNNSCGLWQARLSLLPHVTFYLGGNLKGKVYRMNPPMKEELKENR
jgi:hypothetical protein